MSEAPHIPVMLNEVVEHLAPRDGGVYVDGTFGAGGYSRAILEKANCKVVGIDRDMSAIEAANDMINEFDGRLILVHGTFGDVRAHLNALGIERIDGFVLDIGVSSMQIDQAARGFSFRFDGPLDMRMDTSSGQTAQDIVMRMEEEDLANLIYKYGEERLSRRIARAIVRVRSEAIIETTEQLADIVRGCIPRSGKNAIDPATRTFQALRIAVNDELGQLEQAIESAPDILSEDGRLVIVTFHSLEDRIVKKAFQALAGKTPQTSRHLPQVAPSQDVPSFGLLSRKAVLPTDKETQTNPRARSAKLRSLIKLKEAA